MAMQFLLDFVWFCFVIVFGSVNMSVHGMKIKSHISKSQ